MIKYCKMTEELIFQNDVGDVGNRPKKSKKQEITLYMKKRVGVRNIAKNSKHYPFTTELILVFRNTNFTKNRS